MRIVPIKIPRGADPINYLDDKIRSSNLIGGFIIGIGAFEKVRVGIYRGSTYDVTEIHSRDGYVIEVTSLLGNYLRVGDSVNIHIHVNLARSHNEFYGGHLIEAIVNPFLEVLLIEVGDLSKVFTHRVKIA
ncbi:MAG: DNA-binding protein [Desulfurococcales archaeon]|nr:DNA-binding protein [Desulfurococcales archaeon]